MTEQVLHQSWQAGGSKHLLTLPSSLGSEASAKSGLAYLQQAQAHVQDLVVQPRSGAERQQIPAQKDDTGAIVCHHPFSAVCSLLQQVRGCLVLPVHQVLVMTLSTRGWIGWPHQSGMVQCEQTCLASIRDADQQCMSGALLRMQQAVESW